MYSMIKSIGLRGMEGYVVEVEVKNQDGDETCIIVGLPERAVKESKE